MKEEFQYKSTPDGKAPSGYKKAGTFRNISLHGADPKLIDAFDNDCIARNMSRWQFATNVLLAHPDDGGDIKRFYNIFSKTKIFGNIVKDIEKQLNQSSPQNPEHFHREP